MKKVCCNELPSFSQFTPCLKKTSSDHIQFQVFVAIGTHKIDLRHSKEYCNDGLRMWMTD